VKYLLVFDNGTGVIMQYYIAIKYMKLISVINSTLL